MESLMVLLLVVVGLNLVCVALLTTDVRSIRSALLPGIQSTLENAQHSDVRPAPILSQGRHKHSKFSPGAGTFAVWQWSGSQWYLVPGSVPAGVNPGSPPKYPGAFDGDHVKTWVSLPA